MVIAPRDESDRRSARFLHVLLVDDELALAAGSEECGSSAQTVADGLRCVP